MVLVLVLVLVLVVMVMVMERRVVRGDVEGFGLRRRFIARLIFLKKKEYIA